MSVRRPLTAPLISLLLAAGVVATGCGGDEERTGLLSQTRAEKIRSGLEDVREAVRDGSCTRVDEELGGLRNQLEELPQRTDPDLRDRLGEGVSHLEEIAPIECDRQETETEPETVPETVPEAIPEPVPSEPVPTEPPVETVPPAATQPPADDGGGDEGNGKGKAKGNGNGNDDVLPDSGGVQAPGAE